MDPELKKLFEENLQVAKENNALLKGMRTRARWSTAITVIFYVVVLIVPLFFIQPFLEQVRGAMGNPGQGSSGGGNIFQQYQDLLK